MYVCVSIREFSIENRFLIPTQPAALINTTKTYPNPISLHPNPATHWAQGFFMCTGSK